MLAVAIALAVSAQTPMAPIGRVVMPSQIASTPPRGGADVSWEARARRSDADDWRVSLSTPDNACAIARFGDGAASFEAPCDPQGDPGRIDVSPITIGSDVVVLVRVISGGVPVSSLHAVVQRCGTVSSVHLGDDVARAQPYPWFDGLAPFDRTVVVKDRRGFDVVAPHSVTRWQIDGCTLVPRTAR